MESKSALESKTGKQAGQAPLVMASSKKRVVAEAITDCKIVRPPSTTGKNDDSDRRFLKAMRRSDKENEGSCEDD